MNLNTKLLRRWACTTQLVVAIFVCVSYHVESNNAKPLDRALKVLDDRMKMSYDKRIQPSAKPLNVIVSLFIREITKIDEEKQSISAKFTLRQNWNDERLSYYNETGRSASANIKSITLNAESDTGIGIWRPDTSFANSQDTKSDDITEVNRFFRISPNGNISYIIRLTTTLGCPMSFHHFPMGTQTCNITLLSNSRMHENLQYAWETSNPVTIMNKLQVGLYNLPYENTDGKSYLEYDKYKLSTEDGDRSVISTKLKLKRKGSYEIATSYIPLLMLVTVSWLSFWIDPSGIQSVSRIVIVIACLLYGSSFTERLNSRQPVVGYTMGINFWTGTCITFLWCACLQNVFLLYLNRFDTVDQNDQNAPKICGCTKGCLNARPCERTVCELMDILARWIYPILFIMFAVFHCVVQLQE